MNSIERFTGHFSRRVILGHRARNAFGWVLVAGAIGIGATKTDAATDPYAGIVDRNVFGLREPPKPPDPTPEPVATASKLTLAGITTIFGSKNAIITAQVAPKPPEPARQESYMLAEGQREAGIEVVSIDEKNGVVKVNNNGVQETLDFVNNGAKLVASPIPTLAGQPGAGHVNLRTPPQIQGVVGAPGTRTLPTAPRTMRTGNTATPAAPYGQPGVAGGVPIRNPAAALRAQPQFQNRMTAEEQTLYIESQRLQLLQQGKQDEAAMLPPTEATQEVLQSVQQPQ